MWLGRPILQMKWKKFLNGYTNQQKNFLKIRNHIYILYYLNVQFSKKKSWTCKEIGKYDPHLREKTTANR